MLESGAAVLSQSRDPVFNEITETGHYKYLIICFHRGFFFFLSDSGMQENAVLFSHYSQIIPL